MGHVFSLSACQAIYGILIVVGALFGARWGINGVATATLLALLVFYLLLYGLTAKVSGASVWSFLRVHARPSLVFVIVLATASLGRSWLLRLDLPPVVILIATVTLGIVALIGATRLLENRLWGDFLYEQGLTALGRYTPATETENREHDDLSA
jgi:PST family polysaccharide transporter